MKNKKCHIPLGKTSDKPYLGKTEISPGLKSLPFFPPFYLPLLTLCPLEKGRGRKDKREVREEGREQKRGQREGVAKWTVEQK